MILPSGTDRFNLSDLEAHTVIGALYFVVKEKLALR